MQGLEPLAQRGGEAVRQERHEQVRFDPVGPLMVNGPQSQVAFQGAEGFLDEHQLHVATPEPFRIVGAGVGAQQITEAHLETQRRVRRSAMGQPIVILPAEPRNP